MWAIPVLGVLAVAIGAFFLLRRYRRGQRFDRVSDRVRRGSSDRAIGKEMAREMMEGGLPWWHWRRWGRREERAHYFALTERGSDDIE